MCLTSINRNKVIISTILIYSSLFTFLTIPLVACLESIVTPQRRVSRVFSSIDPLILIVLNIGRYTGISTEIPVFYPKRYDKCKNLSDIVLDRYGPIYRHVADISADIRDEISDISADTVTYLDNYYFCCLRLFYFVVCSLWYFNDVFI